MRGCKVAAVTTYVATRSWQILLQFSLRWLRYALGLSSEVGFVPSYCHYASTIQGLLDYTYLIQLKKAEYCMKGTSQDHHTTVYSMAHRCRTTAAQVSSEGDIHSKCHRKQRIERQRI